MKYAIPFAVLALYLGGMAFLFGGFAWLLMWPAVSFALVAGANAGLGPRVFGKRPDGRLAWWAVLALLPYLLLTWTVWHLQRLVSRALGCQEVTPGWWIGRRVFVGELPADASLVVDLTAEFPLARGVARGRQYRCLPTPDGRPSDEPGFRRLLAEAAGWPGTVYVLCALGHGRSASFLAAILVARGLAPDVARAERMIREVRPGVRLSPEQRRLAERAVGPREATPATGV